MNDLSIIRNTPLGSVEDIGKVYNFIRNTPLYRDINGNVSDRYPLYPYTTSCYEINCEKTSIVDAFLKLNTTDHLDNILKVLSKKIDCKLFKEAPITENSFYIICNSFNLYHHGTDKMFDLNKHLEDVLEIWERILLRDNGLQYADQNEYQNFGIYPWNNFFAIALAFANCPDLLDINLRKQAIDLFFSQEYLDRPRFLGVEEFETVCYQVNGNTICNKIRKCGITCRGFYSFCSDLFGFYKKNAKYECDFFNQSNKVYRKYQWIYDTYG